MLDIVIDSREFPVRLTSTVTQNINELYLFKTVLCSCSKVLFVAPVLYINRVSEKNVR